MKRGHRQPRTDQEQFDESLNKVIDGEPVDREAFLAWLKSQRFAYEMLFYGRKGPHQRAAISVSLGQYLTQFNHHAPS